MPFLILYMLVYGHGLPSLIISVFFLQVKMSSVIRPVVTNAVTYRRLVVKIVKILLLDLILL